MEVAAIGGDMDEVMISLKKIENGYLICRSWSEKVKGQDYPEHKDEKIYMKSLPSELEKFFKKGSMKGGEDRIKSIADALGGKDKKDEKDDD